MENEIKKRIYIALTLTGITYLLCSGAYFLLSLVMDRVFGALIRMYCYHFTYPYQYIFIVCLSFGIFGTIWDKYCRKMTGIKKRLSIIFLLILTVLYSSVFGGILWKIHDMQAGYFTTGMRFVDDLKWGAMAGLLCGWMIVLLSIPFNIITGIVMYQTLKYTTNYFEDKEL